MDSEQRFQDALQATDPARALRLVVHELAAQGYPKQAVMEMLGAFLLPLRAACRQADEEVVLDVLDALAGWCHPDARLLPDK